MFAAWKVLSETYLFLHWLLSLGYRLRHFDRSMWRKSMWRLKIRNIPIRLSTEMRSRHLYRISWPLFRPNGLPLWPSRGFRLRLWWRGYGTIPILPVNNNSIISWLRCTKRKSKIVTVIINPGYATTGIIFTRSVKFSFSWCRRACPVFTGSWPFLSGAFVVCGYAAYGLLPCRQELLAAATLIQIYK